jgi:hypothetical protein
MIVSIVLGFCVFFHRDVETLEELGVCFFNQLLEISICG